MKPHPNAVLIALGCTWGTSFLFIKVILDDISPLELVTARMFLGAFVMMSFLFFNHSAIPRQPSFLAKVTVFAIFSNVIPFALIAWAETHIDSGVTSVLNSTMPLFTGLFAAVILVEEEFTMRRILGLIAGLAGVAVLAGRDIVDLTDSSVVGQLAVVGAAACYGAMGVFARTLLRSNDPVTLTGLQLSLGALVALLVTLPVEGVPDYGALSMKAWGALLVLGLIGSGVSQWVYLWLVDNTGSVRASLVTYVIPIVGLLLGWAVLNEHLGANVIGGLALIVVGVAAVLRGEGLSSERETVSPSSEVIDVAPAD